MITYMHSGRGGTAGAENTLKHRTANNAQNQNVTPETKCKVVTHTLCKPTAPSVVIVPQYRWFPSRYMYTYMDGICIAAEQLRCSPTVVWWTGSAGREPLHSPAPDWTHQLGTSRYMPTGSTPPTPRGTPTLPWSAKSNTVMMVGAQSTVGIQGPETVHEADRSVKVTHWLSCTAPRCSWRVPVHPHVATHRVLVHTQSISRGTWCLLFGSYA